MKPWELLGETRTPDGSDVRLTRQDSEYVILVDGKTLMSSRRHGSEEALATLGVPARADAEEPHVLVGGLGMGFTLRATLDLLPPDAIVTVAELLPAVVEWNRGPLGALAGHPLKDPRVRIELGDVGRGAACVGAVRLRCNPAGRGQRPGRVHASAQHAGSTTTPASAPRTRRSAPAACWPCGRPGTIASSSSACASTGSLSRSRACGPA